jgi:hypothetical protein
MGGTLSQVRESRHTWSAIGALLLAMLSSGCSPSAGQKSSPDQPTIEDAEKEFSHPSGGESQSEK